MIGLDAFTEFVTEARDFFVGTVIILLIATLIWRTYVIASLRELIAGLRGLISGLQDENAELVSDRIRDHERIVELELELAALPEIKTSLEELGRMFAPQPAPVEDAGEQPIAAE